jgi:hypothetical protein
MNVQRGFFRIWIGVSALWVMWMGVMAVWMDFPSLFGETISRPATVFDNLRLVAAAIGVPMVLLVIGRGVGWIASGFRKQSS